MAKALVLQRWPGWIWLLARTMGQLNDALFGRLGNAQLDPNADARAYFETPSQKYLLGICVCVFVAKSPGQNTVTYLGIVLGVCSRGIFSNPFKVALAFAFVAKLKYDTIGHPPTFHFGES